MTERKTVAPGVRIFRCRARGIPRTVERALKESSGDVRPAATTMIFGARVVDKDMKMEIEADALVLVLV